jgi:calcineurin-like phosphoesterase family protein
MTTFFTSDHHFGHSNIIKYTKRPFQDVYHMDETMILRWNETVDDEDVVWHLGDFTLADLDIFLLIVGRLNGRINIVPGGHDWRWMGAYKDVMRVDGFRIPGTEETYLYPPLHSLTLERKGKKELPIVMCHYPMLSWDRSHYGSIHLHGHVHNTWRNVYSQSNDTQLPPDQDRGVRINLSVENWDYRPVSLEKILDIAKVDGILRT